ncbi:hypothetical protein CI610_03300 [invertebrate metagenome]|uniref:Uncharacterized protein n=1 Tax=invertebrate metagenome TaxID=1711999 RepID=A0A2H9T3H4_9ZZZZ
MPAIFMSNTQDALKMHSDNDNKKARNSRPHSQKQRSKRKKNADFKNTPSCNCTPS